MRVLVTGASGFLGRAVLQCVSIHKQIELRGTVRRKVDDPIAGVTYLQVGDLGPDTVWHYAVVGADVLVHTAARVHTINDTAIHVSTDFRRVNVEGTLNLARQAARAGVRRFVFISSIKVNGENTLLGKPYRADDDPAPVDAYGISKYEAEQGLRDLASATSMELVIIRPVLVYGPGVKANFASMMRWIHRGVPLPLGGIHNKRSLVALDNLVDLILTCSMNPAAANQVFLVGDGEDLSTTELLRRIGKALGKPARLFSTPTGMLEGLASVFGRRELARRLCGSLQVDITKTRDLLGWSPVVSVDEGLRKTAQYFLGKQQQ